MKYECIMYVFWLIIYLLIWVSLGLEFDICGLSYCVGVLEK